MKRSALILLLGVALEHPPSPLMSTGTRDDADPGDTERLAAGQDAALDAQVADWAGQDCHGAGINFLKNFE